MFLIPRCKSVSRIQTAFCSYQERTKESIVAGLQEAIEDAKSKEKKLPRRVVTVVPVKEYNASEVKKIRNETGMSQKTFASYLGVSCKTVEAWESGINHPSGAA